MPTYTDPETKKSIFSKTPLSEDEISEGLGLAKGTQTTETKPLATPPSETIQSKIGHFIWPGAEQAKKDFIKGTTTALGLGGATAASTFGPLGTALGYAGGEGVGRTIESLTGVSKPQTLSEATLETAKDVGIGMLPWAIGKTAKVPGIVKEAVTKPWTKAGKVEKVFETVGGKLEPPLAGEAGLAGAKEQLSNVSKVGHELYESAKKLAPEESPAQLKNLSAELNRTLTDEMASTEEKSFAQKWLKKISPPLKGSRRFGVDPELEEHILGGLEDQAGEPIRPSTFREAYAHRSELSKATTQKGAVGWRAGQYLDALHKDISESAEKLEVPGAKKAFQDAINHWRDKVVPQRNVMNLIDKKSPENVATLLLKDMETAQQIKAGMSPEKFQNLKQGLLTDVSNKVEGNPIKVAEKLRSLLAKKSDSMKVVFDPEELEAIRLSGDPGKLGRYFEEHPKARWIAKRIGYLAGGMAAYGIVRPWVYGRHDIGPGLSQH